MKQKANHRTPIVLLGLALVVLAAPATAEKKAARDRVCDRDDFAGEQITLRGEAPLPFLRPGFTKAACHGIISCQPGYPSCAGWSPWTSCDDPFCGDGPFCEDCGDIGPCPGPAMKQRSERFRVCFNSQNQPCTEWTFTSSILGCGCE